MTGLRKQAIEGKVETLLLGILEAGPGYGYQLIQDLNARTSGLLALGEGTIYPVLHRMEKRGQVAASWRQAAGGRRRQVLPAHAARPQGAGPWTGGVVGTRGRDGCRGRHRAGHAG